MFRFLLCLVGLAAATQTGDNAVIVKLIKNMLGEETGEQAAEAKIYEDFACENRDKIKQSALNIILYEKTRAQASNDEALNQKKENDQNTEMSTQSDNFDAATAAVESKMEEMTNLRSTFEKLDGENKKLQAAYKKVMSVLANVRPSLVQFGEVKNYLRTVLMQNVKGDLVKINKGLLALEQLTDPSGNKQGKRKDVMTAVIDSVKEANEALRTQMNNQRSAFRTATKDADKQRMAEQRKANDAKQARDAADGMMQSYKGRRAADEKKKNDARGSKEASSTNHQDAIQEGIERKSEHDKFAREVQERIDALNAAKATMSAQRAFIQVQMSPRPVHPKLALVQEHKDHLQMALSLIAKKALKSKDAALTAFVVQASKKTGTNAFGQVVATIKEMMDNIAKQIEEITSSNSECNDALANAKDQLQSSQSEVESASASMQDANNRKNDATKEANEQKNIKDHTTESLQRETTHYNEYSSHLTSVKTRVEGNMDAVDEKFFKSDLTSNAGLTFNGGKNDAGEYAEVSKPASTGGVAGSIDQLADTLVKYYNDQLSHHSTTSSDLTKATSDFEKNKDDMNKAILDATQAESDANDRKAAAATDLATSNIQLGDAEDSLDKANKIMDGVNKSCVQGEGIAERVEARKAQIESLKAALGVLRQG